MPARHDRRLHLVGRGAQTALSAAPTAYEIHVIASDIEDVVRSVGGWLFDRTRAGWTVNVVVPCGSDPRPLHILGVREFEIQPTLTAPVQAAATDSLAVSTEVLLSNPVVREHITTTARHGCSEVMLWGSEIPIEFSRGFTTLIHRLSPAAVAFKSHALLAARAPHTCGRTEQLLCGPR